MGRKRIDIKLIENKKNRNSTFKKRRIGLLRKAMELSMLTGTVIQLKIYRPQDLSLVEYFSTNEKEFDSIERTDDTVVKKHHLYFNRDFDSVQNIDDDDITIRLKSKWDNASKFDECGTHGVDGADDDDDDDEMPRGVAQDGKSKSVNSSIKM